MLSVHGVMLKQSDQEKYKLLAVTFMRSRIILYKSGCIEGAIFGKTISNTDSKDGSQSHSCSNEDNTFYYQLYQYGVENLFHNPEEVIIR